MKKILLTAIVIIITTNLVSAKLKIPACFPCETVEVVQELPANSKIQELAKQKVNLSYLNNEYGILWTSVWNTGGKYVLSDATNTTYFEIDAQTAKLLKDEHKFDIATAESPLSFWKKIGGKIVAFAIIGIIIWGILPSKEEDVKPTNI